MRNSFQVALLVSAALPMFARAQLPRECFYVTDLFGPVEKEADLLSNLPSLVSMYKPGMRLDNIVIQHDDEDETMNGLQVNLSDLKYGNLELPTIGSDVDDWSSQKFTVSAPDSLSILMHATYGVCDVILYQGNESISLGGEPIFCAPGFDDIHEKTLELPYETPLVGFHGMVDVYGIVSLGPILLDTMDPICQNPLDFADTPLIDGLDIYVDSKMIEDAITEDERVRAEALESILMYDKMVNARETKQELRDQIKAMHEWTPIQLHDQIGDIDSLKLVLDRLDVIENQDLPATKEELRATFSKLADFYYEREGQLSVDITLRELKQIFNHFTLVYSMPEVQIKSQDSEQFITINDLTLLLDTLSKHYAEGKGPINADLDQETQDALMDFFTTLSDYYLFGIGAREADSDDLWVLFDLLADVYGRKSDYDLEDHQVEDLFNYLQSNEMTYFEGNEVDSLQDLVDLQDSGRDETLDELWDQVDAQAEIEIQGQQFIQRQYAEMSQKFEALLDRVDDEDDRLQGIQKLIKKGQKEQKKKQGSIDAVNHKELAPNALKKGDMLTDISHAGSVNPATIDPSTVLPEQLPNHNIAAPMKMATETGVPAIDYTQESDEVTGEVTMSEKELIYTFAAISMLTLVLGLCFGSICVYCLMSKIRADRRDEATSKQLRDGSIDVTENSGIRPLPSIEANFQTQADNQVMDTQEEDDTEEVKDSVQQIDCTDDDDEDIGKILEKRGLNFQAPRDRRSTYQITRQSSKVSAESKLDSPDSARMAVMTPNKKNNAL